jgi:hypothetical protein
MSQAFVREGDHQELSDVSPTLNGLIVFLSRENNGIHVGQKREYMDKGGRIVHVMSNGFSYSKNREGKWEVYEAL